MRLFFSVSDLYCAAAAVGTSLVWESKSTSRELRYRYCTVSPKAINDNFHSVILSPIDVRRKPVIIIGTYLCWSIRGNSLCSDMNPYTVWFNAWSTKYKVQVSICMQSQRLGLRDATREEKFEPELWLMPVWATSIWSVICLVFRWASFTCLDWLALKRTKFLVTVSQLWYVCLLPTSLIVQVVKIILKSSPKRHQLKACWFLSWALIAV